MSFTLTCRQGRVGWTLSHPHADLWATIASGSVFRFSASSWWMYSAHIVNMNPIPIHKLHILFRPHPCLLLSTHRHKYLHWAVPHYISNQSFDCITWVISSKYVWDRCVISLWYPVIPTSSCFKVRWRLDDLPALGCRNKIAGSLQFLLSACCINTTAKISYCMRLCSDTVVCCTSIM